MAGSLKDLDHTVITCPTKGGKSFLARQLVAKFRRAGNDVLMCDPLGYSWPASWVTTDLDELMAKAKATRNCALFIDEAGETELANDPNRYKWFYTASRHQGHVCYTMAQDYTQIPLRVRKNAAQLYLFRCDPKEAEEWAKKFHIDREFILKTAPFLPKYEFIRVSSWGQPIGPCRVVPTD
jgi:hypothetical protein